MRKFHSHYIKGVKNAAALRDVLVKEEDIKKVIEILDKIAENE